MLFDLRSALFLEESVRGRERLDLARVLHGRGVDAAAQRRLVHRRRPAAAPPFVFVSVLSFRLSFVSC